MGRPISDELQFANYAMRRFLRIEMAEAAKLSYPTMATFAREIARGTVSVPPPTLADPLMEATGSFYYQRLSDIDRQVLAIHYLGAHSRLKMGKRRFQQKVHSALSRCADWLAAKGF